jgi:hypothetical protein
MRMPSLPPRKSYHPPPSHHPPSGGFALPVHVTRLSTPVWSTAPAAAPSRPYEYELDEEMGLLVGRRRTGPHPEASPLIAEAQRRFEACAGRKHQPKINLLLVDADVEPPDAHARTAYATAAITTSGLFVVVSPSPRARMAALAIAAMKGEGGAKHAGYADFELALDWVEQRRPAIRFRLVAMRAKLFAPRVRRD